MRTIISRLVPFVLLFGLVGCRTEPATNVILISLDTLRADHLGCYGYERPTSPFLDSLAERGTLFETAIVQLPGTLPSHMSMFTSLYPNEHGVFPPNGKLAASIPTLPETLQAAGYRTAGFTEGGYVAGHFGFDRGFDRFDDTVPKWTNDIEVVFSRGLEFIQQASGSRPFFLFLHTYAIHDPYFPPLPYTTRYLDDLESPDGFEPFRHDRLPLMDAARTEEHKRIYKATRHFVTEHLPPGADLPTGPLLAAVNQGHAATPNGDALTYYRALYDGSINYVDDVLRAFFGSLEERGLLENTLIIITSDHGEEFLEHGKLTHEQVYNECLHVPLIVLSPNRTGGRRVPEIVRSIDLAPTIYEFTEVEPPPTQSGHSLAGLLDGGGHWPVSEAFARDADNLGWSLHHRDDALYQAVRYRSGQDGAGTWFSEDALLPTNHTTITFRAMSYHQPRTVAVSVDGTPLTTLAMTPEWQEFTLSVEGDGETRNLFFHTPGCASPAEIEGTDDRRCLSFRIAGFPRDTLELFDLEADPTGTDDVMTAHPDRAAELAERMRSYSVDPEAASETVDLSEEDIERLKSLGYLQ